MNIKDFLIQFPVIIGLTGIFTYVAASILLSFELKIELILISFFYTYLIYSLNRLLELKEDKISYPERFDFIQRNKKILTTTCLIAFFVSLYLALIDLKILVLLSIAFIFIILYSKESKKIPRIKNIYLIKNIATAATWALCLTLLPVLYFGKITFIPIILVTLFMFLRTLQDTIFCDLRDAVGDKTNKIKTLPIVVGKKKTINILYVISFTSFLIILLGSLLGIVSKAGYLIFFVLFYNIMVLKSADKKDLKFLSEILADAEYLLIGFLALISILWL